MTDQESIAAPELLYATTESGDLLLIPAGVAGDVAHAREMPPGFLTWGDARRDLPVKYFLELVDEFIRPGEEPPADDEPLDVRSLMDAGDWPGIYRDDVHESQPEEIVGWCRSSRFELGYSPVVIAAEDPDDLIRYMRESGIVCHEDTGILGLLVY